MNVYSLCDAMIAFPLLRAIYHRLTMRLLVKGGMLYDAVFAYMIQPIGWFYLIAFRISLVYDFNFRDGVILDDIGSIFGIIA